MFSQDECIIVAVIIPAYFLLAGKMATQSMQINAGPELCVSLGNPRL